MEYIKLSLLVVFTIAEVLNLALISYQIDKKMTGGSNATRFCVFQLPKDLTILSTVVVNIPKNTAT